MKIYRLDIAAAEKSARRRLTIIGFVVICAMFICSLAVTSGGLVIQMLQSNDLDLILLALLNSASVVVPFIVAGFFTIFLLRFLTNRQRAIWKSVEVEMGLDYVARRQQGAGEVVLRRDEIVRIEDIGTALLIRTSNKYRGLNIPKIIIGFDEIPPALQSWGFSIENRTSRTRIQSIFVAILSALSVFFVLFAFDLWTQLIALTLMFAFFGYFYYQLRRYEGVNPRFRRSYLFGIGAIGLVGICKLLSFLFLTFSANPPR